VAAAGAAGAEVSHVDDTAMAGLSETVTPQGIVAVCEFVDVPAAAALTPPPRLAAVLYEINDPGNAGTVLRAAGVRVLAADGGGETDLDAELDAGRLAAPTAWLFGNEARGLPREVAALADARVRIPLHGGAESLNLAAAAAVCLYASARAQRA
jgi:TrmH family RNA methyltransferase